MPNENRAEGLEFVGQSAEPVDLYGTRASGNLHRGQDTPPEAGSIGGLFILEGVERCPLLAPSGHSKSPANVSWGKADVAIRGRNVRL